MRKILWSMALSAFLLSARPSSACDVPFHPPLKDLVARSSVIVRARTRVADNTSAASSGQVEFAVVTVLKGTLSETVLRIPGYLQDLDNWNTNPPPDIRSRVGPGGNCYAQNYRPGAEYLLLLSPKPPTNTLTPYWIALARTNEQLRGDDDPWLVWVIRELGL